MADLDRLLRSDISHAAAQAAEPPDFTPIEHRGKQRRRRTRTMFAAAAAAVVVLVGAGSVQVLTGRDAAPPTPIVPPPDPTPTGWTGPLREGSLMPVVTQPAEPDGRDAAFGGIDILETSSGGGDRRNQWRLELRARPPRASTLDPARTIVEYGVVIDAEEDGDADCQIGINNDAPKAGGYRWWVTNVTTGVTDERVGPPYGDPIDIFYPDEEPGSRSMLFSFIPGIRGPCDPLYVPASYYAYASRTEAGRVTAWDYAPDAAWLEMP